MFFLPVAIYPSTISASGKMDLNEGPGAHEERGFDHSLASCFSLL